MDILTVIKSACAVMGGGLSFFFGGWDGFLLALLLFVIVDYATGIIVAIHEKKLNSQVGARGICKKVFIFLLVGVAAVIDSFTGLPNDPIRTGVIFFYLANEGISILENAGKIGLPLPDKLKDIFTQLKDKK